MSATASLKSQDFAAYEMMSAGLLAQQPLDEVASKSTADYWAQTYVHLEGRLGALRTWRYRIWAHWAELARYILPRRYHWLVVANRMDKGGQINESIYDSTATLAMQICAAGLWTGLTSPSRPWFKLEKAVSWVELDQEAQEWIDDTEDVIYTILAKSNIYDILAQAFQDIVVFGTAPIIVYEDFKDVIRGYLPCAGEYFLADSGRLDNDTLYREFTLTIANIVGMFGIANCPEEIVKLWRAGKASLEEEYIVAHAIEPNFAIDNGAGKPMRPVSEKFPYRECYWLRGIATPKPLSVRGFNEKPFFAGRWTTVSNDAYGRSIGMDALPDVKQLQLETKRKAEYIDKGVRPPMGADVNLKNEPSSIISGQVTYIPTAALAGAKQGFFPLFEPNPAWLTGITADIEMVKKRIESTFFVDLFMAISKMEGVQPRNELELSQRNLERLQVLGPFIDKFLNEVANPLLVRVYNVAKRRGKLKPKPQSLQGVPLKADFVSIMKLAQRQSELVSMKDVLVTGATAANAALSSQMPNPLRVINLDEWMRDYAELGGLKSKLLFTQKQVAQHDQIHMQALKSAQAANAGAQALPAVQAAHTLSQTPMGGNSALSAIMGGGQGGQQ